MSGKEITPRHIVTPEEYARNAQKVAEYTAHVRQLAEMNEVGLQNYKTELMKKIQEGQEAM